MTKTLKNIFVALVLAIFVFLPFVLAGCNEKEIEEYKAQISTLQEQNTSLQEQNTNYGTQVAGLQQQKTQLEQQNSSLQEQKASLEQQKASLEEQNASLEQQNSSLQEQVDTIHSPTAQEREAFNIIESAITKLRTAGKDNMANAITTISGQFWGVELDEVLNCIYDASENPGSYKMQIIVGTNGIDLKTCVEYNGGKQYAFYTIIFDPDTKNIEQIRVTYYISGDSPTAGVESDTTIQENFTSGEVLETAQQLAQEYDTLQTTQTVNLIMTDEMQ